MTLVFSSAPNEVYNFQKEIQKELAAILEHHFSKVAQNVDLCDFTLTSQPLL